MRGEYPAAVTPSMAPRQATHGVCLHLQHGELATETLKDGMETFNDGRAMMAALRVFPESEFWRTCFPRTLLLAYWSVASP
jgi:hypothetical protein